MKIERLGRCLLSGMMLSAAAIAPPALGASNPEPLVAAYPAWAEPLGEDASDLADPNTPLHIHQSLQGHIGKDADELLTAWRARILKPEGLQIGNLSIPWMPGSATLAIHRLQILRNEETIDVLKDSTFTVTNPQTDAEAAILSGVYIAQLQVPGLKVGDTLDVAYSIKGRDPALSGASSFLMQAPVQALSGKFGLKVSWDEGAGPRWKSTPDVSDEVQAGADWLALEMTNPTTVNFPKDAPQRYGYARLVEVSTLLDWQTASRQVNALFDKARMLEDESALVARSREIAASHETDLARAEAALALVQDDIRYVYIGLNGANLTPATADETWQRRFGDCKGKTAMLLGLLDRLGIEAQPVLAASTGGDGLQDRLPTIALFDHVLVRAKLDGQWYWLDGTLSADPRPRIAPAVSYRQVLPLTVQGSDLLALSPRPLETPSRVEVLNIDASAGYDAPAEVTMRWIFRGLPAIALQSTLGAMTKASAEDQLLQGFGSGWLVGNEASWRWVPERGALEISVSGSADLDWEADEEGQHELTLHAAGFYPPDKRLRPAKQDRTAPWANDIDSFVCRATTTILPQAAPGLRWDHDTGPMMQEIGGVAYWRVGTIRDGSVRTIQSTRTVKAEISPAEAQQANDSIGDFDNSKSSVFEARRPSGDTLHTKTDKITTVPTAGEIDWLADDVPCSAP
ncbi:DUF3857 domain-containing protein [Altericroceibacterium xinjiangense]|uniref:DUF3857 domain-containing protein n=1 Tax=Altericroceibacterium xinjiangense TaxID=762261 RepID=UPI0013DE8FF7|nr:DUF3857 domain-containing transglutaminase family protein [Altericroceibacterium xinjiangense]